MFVIIAPPITAKIGPTTLDILWNTALIVSPKADNDGPTASAIIPNAVDNVLIIDALAVSNASDKLRPTASNVRY